MAAPVRRTAAVPRPLTPGGLGVVRIVETAEDGWESPSWYAVREIPGTPGGYALARLGTRRLYRVRLGSTPEQSTCECLGSGGNGSTLCRHVGALWKLDRAGRLYTPEREDKMTEKEYKQLQAEAKAEAARLPSEGDETHYLLTLSGSIDDMPCGLFKTAAAAVAVAQAAGLFPLEPVPDRTGEPCHDQVLGSSIVWGMGPSEPMGYKVSKFRNGKLVDVLILTDDGSDGEEHNPECKDVRGKWLEAVPEGF